MTAPLASANEWEAAGNQAFPCQRDQPGSGDDRLSAAAQATGAQASVGIERDMAQLRGLPVAAR